MQNSFDVAIIGAGPSGSTAAALLMKKGLRVVVIEKEQFPRFVIGESLLPHCMEILEEAGFLAAIQSESSFQFKNGAAFSWGNLYTYFDFTKKFSSGPGTTYQVRRAIFDKILIDEAEKQGADVRYKEKVIGFDNNEERVILTIEQENKKQYKIDAAFVLDASGYGRCLPKLLDLEAASDLPVREAHFTHIDDNIGNAKFDRQKILISTHPTYRDVWIWLIPFVDNRCSIGVVGLPERFADIGDSEKILKKFVFECPMLSDILQNANWENEVPYRSINGYSANVKTLTGRHFALLGNASEFLDPVFSSGVTIAIHSAKLASELLYNKFMGNQVDWNEEFVKPLMVGVNTFRAYVNAWYEGSFQDVIFYEQRNDNISEMISSILAGYAWDSLNPFVEKAQQRLAVLAETVGQLTYK